MEKLEIHPIDMRVVCTNRPHLRQMWLLGSLTKGLGCFYNPHQPQVIWTQCQLTVPTPRIVRVKGHASHAVPCFEVNGISASIQMGTFLLFCLPKGACSNRSSCHLILNGVESILKGRTNPSQFSLQLVKDDSGIEAKEDLGLDNFVKRLEINTNDNSMKAPLTKEDHCPQPDSGSAEWGDNVNLSKPLGKESQEPSPHIYPTKSSNHRTLDFEELEEITILAEEADGVPSDDDDDEASDDIHKVIRRRLVADINDMVTEWEKHDTENTTLFTLLLKPTQKSQAWQFTSACISISQNEPDSPSPTLKTKRRGITRTKHISPTSTSTLKKIPKNKNNYSNNFINVKT